VPAELAEPLGQLARRWTGAEDGPEGKAEALVRHLQTEFGYSLRSRTPRGVDPVVAFLDRRSGHCEYFATTLALLARTVGIPTRVVAGFRVVELNPIGGHHVVRERDAHAWVEAHVPGRGWVTLDATPASGPADRSEARTPWASAIADELVSSATRAVIWITDRSPRELLAVAVLALVPWVLVRWLRRRARRGRAPRRASATSYRAPRASVSQLLVALDRRGEPRADSEPLERLASRISRSAKLPPGAGESAADLLFRYAAWRYGDEGEPGAIDAAIASWISRFEAER
jgi:transglutaminase-like putative cysteine protease